jgi:hypothetical protein
MSIRDRWFTRDIAHAAAERRERLREEDMQRDRTVTPDTPTAPVATTTAVAADEIAARDRLVVGPSTRVDTTPRSAPPREATDRVAAGTELHAIFPGEEAGGFRTRWEAIQTGFVDEPRAAVEQADALVAQVVTRLAEVFSDERAQLERQWDRGDNISTEDLRIALKRYRSFFDRLLSV